MRAERRVRRAGTALVLLALLSTPVELRAQPTLVVSPRGPFRTVGDAVRRAAPGARVLVRAGTYREPTVLIDKPLTLEGDGTFPTLDGEGRRELLHVTGRDVTVRGLRFTRLADRG